MAKTSKTEDPPHIQHFRVDTHNVAQMRGVRDFLNSAIERHLMQIAADYGQYCALNGFTSPEKLAQLGPKEDDDFEVRVVRLEVSTVSADERPDDEQ